MIEKIQIIYSKSKKRKAFKDVEVISCKSLRAVGELSSRLRLNTLTHSRQMMMKHREHRHVEITLVRPIEGTRTPLIQPNIRYTQKTTRNTHIELKHSPQTSTRPGQLYSYIEICIHIYLCLYKYQFKGSEEIQVHFHEQYSQ